VPIFGVVTVNRSTRCCPGHPAFFERTEGLLELLIVDNPGGRESFGVNDQIGESIDVLRVRELRARDGRPLRRCTRATSRPPQGLESDDTSNAPRKRLGNVEHTMRCRK